MIDSKQAAPNGANICYSILSCYKQVAPTELRDWIDYSSYKQIAPDGAHACPRENGELISFSKD